MVNNEPCSICEEYIEGVICDKDQCPVGKMKKEIERLKEYEKCRPIGCPNCHRGNFSIDKFCSHCGTQLQGKRKDVRAEAMTKLAKEIINDILPRYTNGHEEIALRISFAISKKIKEMNEGVVNDRT